MNNFRFIWEIAFLEYLETILLQSNYLGCDSFSCDAIHHLPLLVFNYFNFFFFFNMVPFLPEREHTSLS